MGAHESKQAGNLRVGASNTVFMSSEQPPGAYAGVLDIVVASPLDELSL